MAFVNERQVGLGACCRGGASGLGAGGPCCTSCALGLPCEGGLRRAGTGSLVWKVAGMSATPDGYNLALQEYDTGIFSDDATGRGRNVFWARSAFAPPNVGEEVDITMWDRAPQAPAPQQPAPLFAPPTPAPQAPAAPSYDISAAFAQILGTAGDVARQQFTPAPPPKPAAASGLGTGTAIALGLAALGGGFALSRLTRKKKG